MRTLYMPLSKEEISELRAGSEVRKMYHENSWMAMAVAHADGRDCPHDMTRFHPIRKKGVHVINVPLSLADLDRFPEEAVVSQYHDEGSSFRLIVLTQEMYDDAILAVRKKGGGGR